MCGGTRTITASNQGNPNISLKEVEKHYKADDFWCVIDNVVYDLSGYDHPGGRIIMQCPGTDCTEAFHAQHFDEKGKAHKVLKKYKIGDLNLSNSPPSPVMGEFHKRLSKRVAEELKGLPTRPWICVAQLWLDCIGSWIVHYMACCWLTPETPFYWVVLIPWLCECFSHRVPAHAHSIGHCHMFSDKVNRFYELLMLIFATGQMQVYSLPSEKENMRRKLNEPRAIAQKEFLSRRGPYEHQAIHHTKPHAFEEDGCFFFASATGLFRIAPFQKPWFIHSFQNWEWYTFLIESAGLPMVYIYPLSFVLESIYVHFKCGMPLKAIASMLCILWSLVAICAIVIQPIRCNPWAFVCLGLPFRYLMLTPAKLFFLNHRFDALEDNSLSWGERQLKAGRRAELTGPFLWISPIFWYNYHLTFHLDHHLFPGINYLYMPRVSRVVDKTCEEMGFPVDYKVIGWRGVQKAHKETLTNHLPRNIGLGPISGHRTSTINKRL